jgi:5-methylcytosine-specific restriction endonuclease McrA
MGLSNCDQRGYTYRLWKLSKKWTRTEWYHYFKIINRLSEHNQQIFWITYNMYLNTQLWRDFRQIIIKERGHKCEECSNPDSLTLHHETYICIGREKPTHVKVLCWNCHKKIKEEKERDLLELVKS